MIDKMSERVKATEDAMREEMDEKDHRLLLKIDEIKFLTDKMNE